MSAKQETSQTDGVNASTRIGTQRNVNNAGTESHGDQKKIKIAICGAGISSFCLAYGLSRDAPQLEVHIYEASTHLRDESAAFGIAHNAQQALALIAPELRTALDEAGGTIMEPSARVMMGMGPDAGVHVGDLSSAFSPQLNVKRGSFLRRIHQLLPEGVMLHFGKRLVQVDQSDSSSSGRVDDGESDGPVTLTFEDGTRTRADCVFGCDGVNSVVRGFVLGHDHPALHPKYNSQHGFRRVVPLADAEAAFGQEYCTQRTQTIWVGDNQVLLTDHTDHGASMQVIAGFMRSAPWPHPEPWVQWDKKELASALTSWGALGDAVTRIFCDSDEPLYAAARRLHLEPAPTYTKHRVCVVGDAAHTFSPARGAGAGQAIEDALILVALLSAVHSQAHVPAALAVYDAVRRPRRTRVAEMSAHGGRLITGREPGVGLNVAAFREHVKDWNKEIYEYDLVSTRLHALEMLSDAVKSQ